MHKEILRTIVLIIISAIIFSCDNHVTEMEPDEYAGHIGEWDSTRLQRLKSPTGWVNLAGLFWLQEGDNSIGSSVANDLVFPRGPALIGVMNLTDGSVYFTPSEEAGIRADGEDINATIRVFGDEPDAELLITDSLGFFIIQRGDRIGIRLRDYVHPRLSKLQSIDRYPPDQDWIIKAEFIESDEEIVIRVPDVLGEINEELSPGILEFYYQGETHRLYPTGSRERLFVIFGDDTNAIETYGGGRFLSADGPGRDGFVYLDFNKAYSPPCAFSPYATCPLPPRENFLSFAVTAGEKAPDLFRSPD